ncbi:MBL fold metallo-hydrolase [Ramlibacter sp. PS4R-6]|uniref:MBL fold metallo-hydrolase n=1 Tax=Ramlibacter sp. PS4R-6 TaxID=3133438 RepID=UPI0030A3188B
MKKLLAVLLLACAMAYAQVPVDVKKAEIAPGIWQFTVAADGYVENLNSVAIIDDSGVLVFDTTTRPSTARIILAEIRKITNKPVRYVVNSHWHPDHWSGNEVFAAAFPGLEIIATEQERNLMLNMTPIWAKNLPPQIEAMTKALADNKELTPQKRATEELELQRSREMVAELVATKRVYPTLTYTDQLTIHRGTREFRFMSVTGDAVGTTVLYLPREKILITGDAVSHPLPYYTPPLSEHAKSIRALARLDVDIIVPGHGPAFRDKNYMNLEADLFEAAVKRVTRALREGAVSIDEVQAAVSLDDFKDRFTRGNEEAATNFPTVAKGLVRKAYIEARDNREIR